MFTKVKDAKKFLYAGEVFFNSLNEDKDESMEFRQTLNLNDVMDWAVADAHYVPDESLVEVANLFWTYGYSGIIYWVSQQRGGTRSEFYDINRGIDFVTAEEEIKKQIPSSSKRAFFQTSYKIEGKR